ncbi:non-ribosomal peptide synthetase [Belnapia moabensis]|uniref:non-ribosomal peptide synthetase n=1 Tax=Belnapia moabensis TaxID=365533 RepID=UPI0006945B90|nr:non-ribosomal peptide synthetase [Belnapia moabensis]
MSATARPADEIDDIYGLSPMQLGMLLHGLLAPESGAFFEQQVMRLPGGVDARAFAAAWEGVVARTPVLRTSFHWERIERPVQVVRRAVPLPLEILDWSDAGPAEAEVRLAGHLRETRRNGFRLNVAPLFRLVLIRLGPQRGSWFVWHFHHILLDGWSGQLLMREVADLYGDLLRGVPPAPPRRPPFSDYIGWLQRQDPAALEAFWRARLRGLSGPTPFGIGAPAPGRAGQWPNDGEASFTIPVEEAKALRNFARAERLTLNTLFQGAWALLLARYAGEPEVTFGTVVSGRPPDLDGIDAMIGLFINILPTRAGVPGERQVLSWLRELQARQLETAPFQHVSMQQIRQWSGLAADIDPFETVLIFENFPLAETGGGAGLVEEPLYVGRTNVPVTVLVAPGESIRVKVLYDHRRFGAPAIGRAVGHLRNLLLGLARDPEARLRDVPMLGPEERRRVLLDWNATERPGYDEVPLMVQLARQAARTPDAIAFIEGEQRRTFVEIDRRSTRLAHALVARGVAPGDLVAVCLPRSLAAVETFLAVLKARAAYLPLDPAYPAARLSYMLEDARPGFLLAEADAMPGMQGLPRADPASLLAACPDAAGAEDRLPDAAPDDIAYVIYTSGSTGQPKGIAAGHGQILNRLDWIWREYPWAPGEVGVMRTALNFVDSFQEMLGGLLRGVPTVIASGDAARDPDALVELLARHGVTRIWFVPSFLALLLDVVPDVGAKLPRLTFWSSGGEPLSADLRRRFEAAVPHGVLCNTLGASEIWDGTFFDPRRDPVGAGPVPIGRPIANTRAYVLDRHGQPAPIGVTGELCFAGACLASGYVVREADARDRFLTLTVGGLPEQRLYRTGDLVRWREDGVLEYVGRTDFQIKLHGYRIEPSEVEAALRAIPQVADAVVAAIEEVAGRRLVAYALPVGPPPAAGDLLAHARGMLPSFMVPSQIVFVESLPRTPSGKVDRNRLPHPTGPARAALAAPTPRTPLEATVLARVQEVLGASTIDRGANFFSELGGHSLLAARLAARLRDDLGMEVPLRLVFEAPTVAALAVRLGEMLAAAGDAATELLLTELNDLSPEELEALLAGLEGSAQEPLA